MKNIITISITILIIGILMIYLIVDCNKYIYECTDYKGYIVYCTDAYISKGGIFGYTEDGTKIQLTSYKRVLKEECDKK